MRPRRTILALALGLGVVPATGPGPTAQGLSGIEAISAESLWTHAAYLGSDYLAGRAPGTLGAERAAEYLAESMSRLGLEPLGVDGSYFQPVPLHGGTPLPDTRLSLHEGGRRLDLNFERDFLLYSTGAGTLIPEPIPLVFVGYGIVAPEYDYDDYQDVDVEGSIVVFFSGEPFSEQDSYFNGSADTQHSWASLKQLAALSRGAHGSILIPLPRVHGSRSWDEWIRLFGFEHVTTPYDTPHALEVLLRPEQADVLFRDTGFTFRDLVEMDRQGTLRGFPLTWKATFAGEFRERDYLSSNVVGWLPGSDPELRNSFVLVCAHYDHLGSGPAMDGDMIYNGVVDNALGCAALLEIARVLAPPSRRLPRPVVFLLTTAEEKGLLGARFYSRHPAVPLSRTIAAVNLDGASIIDTSNDVVGVGADVSTIGDHLKEAAALLGLGVVPVPPLFRSTDAFTMSDHFAFAEAGVPSILVMEGPSYRNLPAEVGFERFLEWSQRRYHTPFDDLAQPIHLEAVRQYCQINLLLIDVLSRTGAPPRWKPGTEYAAERLRSLAEGR